METGDLMIKSISNSAKGVVRDNPNPMVIMTNSSSESRACHLPPTLSQNVEDDAINNPVDQISDDGVENVADDIADNGSSGNITAHKGDQPAEGKKSEPNCLCKCAFFKGKPCRERYTAKELKEIRARYDSLDHKDLDFVILAKLDSGMHLSPLTARSTKKEAIERKQQNTDYYYHGQSICRDMFKYMHNISQNRLSALIKHYKAFGIRARIHGNYKRIQPNAFSKDDIERMVNFITTYAENYHHKTGSVRRNSQGTATRRINLINTTKKQVYDKYVQSCGKERKISLSRFRSMWKKLLPHIRIMPIVKSAGSPKPNVVKNGNFISPDPLYSYPGYAITSL